MRCVYCKSDEVMMEQGEMTQVRLPRQLPKSRPRPRLESNLTLRHIRHSWRMLSGPDPGIEHSHWSREEIEPSDWMNNCVLLMT